MITSLTISRNDDDRGDDGGDDSGDSDGYDGGRGDGDDADYGDPYATPVRTTTRATPRQPSRRSERIAKSGVLASWAAFFTGSTPMRADAFASVKPDRAGSLPPKSARGGGDEFCDEIDDLFGEYCIEELTKGGNQSKVECYFDRFFAPAFAAKSKGGDTLSYREAMRLYPERCEAACEKEIATLRGFNAFQEVPQRIRCLAAGSRTKGGVRAEQRVRRTSWGALTLEAGKSPTATARRAELPVQ